MKKKPLKIDLELDPDLDLESAYQEAIHRWEGTSDPKKAETLYRTEVFPLACARIQSKVAQLPPVRIALVPVGTQEYSPILAALANPSEKTVFLHTPGSLPFAEAARKALEGRFGEIALLNIGDGTDGVRLTRAVLSEYAAAGLPPGKDVAMDLTGGRKATVAILGALAALKGFRQSYIEGWESKSHKGFFHSERLVYLADVKAILREPDRMLALALMTWGEFQGASALWRTLQSESGAAAGDEAMAAVSEALLAWTNGDWRTAARRLSRASLHPFLAGAAGPLKELAAMARGLDRGKGPVSKRFALLVLAKEAFEKGDRIRAGAILSGLKVSKEERSKKKVDSSLRKHRPKIPPGSFSSWEEALDPSKAAFRILALVFGDEEITPIRPISISSRNSEVS